MAVQVYRDGGTHNIRGFSCEMAQIPPEHLEAHLQNGWRLTPWPEEATATATADDEVSIDPDTLSNEDVRYYAEKLGHPKARTARIETLKKFLVSTDDSA